MRSNRRIQTTGKMNNAKFAERAVICDSKLLLVDLELANKKKMTTTEQLYEKIKTLPEDKQQEVMDFVEFLLQKATKKDSKVNESQRQYGKFKGKIKMSDDFDEPLEDFKEYME